MTLDANIINFSPLPFYKSADEQNAKRWWIYDIYPLYASNKALIPFQIPRVHKQYQATVHTNTKITSSGGLEATTDSTESVYEYSISQFPNFTLRISSNGKAETTESYCLIVCLSEDGNVLFDQTIDDANFAWGYSETIDDALINIPSATKKIYVCSDVNSSIKDNAVAEIHDYKTGSLILSKNLPIISGSNYDVIVRQNLEDMNLPIGRYYIIVKDGFGGQWVSDILTVVDDDVLNAGNYVKLEWYDQQDLVADSGIIIYSGEYPGWYKNIVYLATDLAKPEYIYEEDGENRDGYFFPEKQISKKRYKFGFYAPEYLLDVLRMVRLADYAKVSYKDREYQCSEILLTPTWESEGDVALVEAEFDTDTVVKAVGRILS